MRLKYEMALDQIWAYALMDNVESPHDGLTKLSLHALKANLTVKAPDNQPRMEASAQAQQSKKKLASARNAERVCVSHASYQPANH